MRGWGRGWRVGVLEDDFVGLDHAGFARDPFDIGWVGAESLLLGLKGARERLGGAVVGLQISLALLKLAQMVALG